VREYVEAKGAGVAEGADESSADEGEKNAGAEEASVDPESQRTDDDLRNECKHLLARKITVLKAIINGGIKVPETRRAALKSAFWPDLFKAELTELDAFGEFDVWELVPRPPGANVVGTRWVYDIKQDAEGNILRYKARLVAQGFSQKEGVDFTDTFAPTMHLKTMRLLLSLAAAKKMDVRQYDVSTAFLHASLKEEVFVAQPPGHVIAGKEGWVYRLKKAMYGLRNAPKAWGDFFQAQLSEQGFVQSQQDECLWTLTAGESVIHILYHVDDSLVVSNDEVLRDVVMTALGKRLKLRDEGPPKLFLGVTITRNEDGSFNLDNRHYIEKIARRFNIDEDAKPVLTPAIYNHIFTDDDLPKTAEEKKEAAQLPFQALVGSLIYAVIIRFDVAEALSDVARFMNVWGVKHFKAAVRILRYLYSTRDRCLSLAPKAKENLVLSAYSDATWMDSRETPGVDDKYKNQYGYCTFVDNCLISWKSKRQKSRAGSSMESEFYAADECAREVVWLRRLLAELGMPQEGPTVIYEDNKACISYSKNNTNHDRTKHIDNRAYQLRDFVKSGNIKLVHVCTTDQLADMFTKHQLQHTFIRHRDRIFDGDVVPPSLPPHQHQRALHCNCLCCFVSGA